MTPLAPLCPTLSAEDATRNDWDIVVIGAGPAGAIAALEAARRGVRVLLVDRDTFPRPKVCGCCVNLAALQMLRELGLGALVEEFGTDRLRGFRLASRGRIAEIPIQGGVAVSRERFDWMLIRAAIGAGVQFLDSTRACLREADEGQEVVLGKPPHQSVARAKVAIVASGLGSKWQLFDAPPSTQVSRASRVGVGTVLPALDSDYVPDQIYMACHADGYVGLVRLEDGRLDIAAALDAQAIKRDEGASRLILRILRQSGLPPVHGLEQHDWRGTSRLTQRQPRLFGDGYFLIGDAAGYIEPFTGEGMAWAIATGRSVVPHAIAALSQEPLSQGLAWTQTYRRLLGRRRRRCRSISLLVRRPLLVLVAIKVLGRFPGWARTFANSLNTPYPAPDS